MNKKDVINLLILLSVISVATYMYVTKIYTAKCSKILLDTIVEITANSKSKNVKTMIDSTMNYIQDYENKLSYYKKSSEVWKINNSKSDSISISEDIFNMLEISADLYKKSDGLYDVTIGQLTDIWDFDKKIIPDSTTIHKAINNSGFNKIRYGENYLIRPFGIKLNFGSIAKGYIVDKAIQFMKNRGLISGFINAGGDICFFGDVSLQKIGVQHPRNKNELIAILNMDANAVVTSGDYERSFEFKGVNYHHILNPFTGYPAKNTISVTVIAPTASAADAMATTIFLMQPEKAIELIKTYNNVEAMIYYKKSDEIISLKTMGMKKYLVSENEK